MTPLDFIDRPLDALRQPDPALIFDVAELSAPPVRKRLLKALLRRLNKQTVHHDELLAHTAYALAALSGKNGANGSNWHCAAFPASHAGSLKTVSHRFTLPTRCTT